MRSPTVDVPLPTNREVGTQETDSAFSASSWPNPSEPFLGRPFRLREPFGRSSDAAQGFGDQLAGIYSKRNQSSSGSKLTDSL
jgi:hypothetical protein